jgi:sarcosine oxidase subunit gamma
MRRPPFIGSLPSGANPRQAGIVLSARCDLNIFNLRGNPRQPALLAAARAALGCALPLAPNTVAVAPRAVVLWLGPDQWLLVGGNGWPEADLTLEGGFVTDVSHVYNVVRIRGSRTRELLAKGCTLDLHARTFTPGSCAQTAIAQCNVLLHLLDADGSFDLYTARSYANHIWHWLATSAAEFGYQVDAGRL